MSNSPDHNVKVPRREEISDTKAAGLQIKPEASARDESLDSADLLSGSRFTADKSFRPQFDLSSAQTAFDGVSDRELRFKAALFSLMGQSWLNKLAELGTPLALRWGLPIKSLIRNTIYWQFCGGENLDEVSNAVTKLNARGVSSILDYAIEGEQTESAFDSCAAELGQVIDSAEHQLAVSYVAVKYTGLVATELLAKKQNGEIFTSAEAAAFDRFLARVDSLANKAAEKGVKLFVDAEESWIQGSIDSVTTELMERYNTKSAIIHTTFQMYRTDRLDFLQKSIQEARDNGYVLGLKLVRGAYMEKEREHAAKLSAPSPIHTSKKGSDDSFNQAVEVCLGNLPHVHLCIASHNTDSCEKALKKMQELDIPFNHSRVCFAQLYGMSDALSFGLAQAGASVSKYLPYGPVEKVLPYLIRRAKENSSIRGQTGRELNLIRSELARRREDK